MRFLTILIALFAALTLCIPLAVTAVLDPPAFSADAGAPQTSEPAASVSAPAQAASAPARAQTRPLTPSFCILDRSTGEIRTVARLDFIRGAVASEMPADYAPAALAAQAVAAHTWAVYQTEHRDPALGEADFSADPSHDEGYVTKARFFERYGDGAEAAWQSICEAADFAQNRLLLYEGEPALCAYHAMSAGRTEDAANVWQASVPYLVPVESEGDLLDAHNEATVSFGTAQMRALLTLAFPDASLGDDPAGWIAVGARSPSGYVTEVTVGGAAVRAQQLRTALGLRSTDFTYLYENGVFTFTTHGYGHGVGMSQVGANYLARQGATAEEILLHYYPGTELAEFG